MILNKKIKECYLIKVQDDKFTDALQKAMNEGWIPWGEPTFLRMGRDNYPSYVMVYLVMVKFMESKLAVRRQRHIEE